MSELKTILINRDGMTDREADAEIKVMINRVMSGADPEDVLYEIGLEPDYVFDLLF